MIVQLPEDHGFMRQSLATPGAGAVQIPDNEAFDCVD
jgi:hypothetical protein